MLSDDEGELVIDQPVDFSTTNTPKQDAERKPKEEINESYQVE